MFTNKMIKKAVTVSMATVMMLSVFTACGSKAATEGKKETKPAATTTVKANKETTKKEETTKTVENITTTKAYKETTTLKRKVAVPSTTKKYIPAQTRPETTKKVIDTPYGYYYCWDTLEGMEADCKAYAESIGLDYYDGPSIMNDPDTGISFAWQSIVWEIDLYDTPEDRKKEIFDEIDFAKELGEDTVKVFFLTQENYKTVAGDDIDAWQASNFRDPKRVITIVGRTSLHFEDYTGDEEYGN